MNPSVSRPAQAGPRRIDPHSSRYLWLSLLALALFAIAFFAYIAAERELDRAHEIRLHAYALADELRQSSDDLTRMVRTYVATGDIRYKQRYQKIVDIRNGRIPRPRCYGQVYWDLILSDREQLCPDGPAIPLLALMVQTGFAAEDFDFLKEAKTNSDALIKVEEAAMALIESTPGDQAARLKATEMLTDTSYHLMKSRIMHSIRDFQELLEQRTQKVLQSALDHAAVAKLLFLAFVVSLIALLVNKKRALDEIKRQQEYLRAIFDTEPECVKVVAPNGVLTDMNPAGLALLEVDSVDEAQTISLLGFVDAPYRDAFSRLHQTVINGQSGELELTITGAKGTRRWLHTRATPLHDGDGEVIGLLAITQDISERKAREQAGLASAAKAPRPQLVDDRPPEPPVPSEMTAG